MTGAEANNRIWLGTGATGVRWSLIGAILLGAGAGAAYYVGAVKITFALGMTAVMIVAVCWPVVPTLATFLLAGAGGSFAGHWIAPGVTLPVFELLLAAAALGSVVWLLRAWDDRSRVGTLLALLWLPAAVYALALVVFLNQRDLIAGAREAILLGYPLLIALPLALVSPMKLRRFVDDHAWKLVAIVAAAAVVTGIVFYAIGNTIQTSTGQLRTLGGDYMAPAGAAVLVAAWLAVYRKRYVVAIGLAALGIVALLMINHRSAYLGLILALIAFAATGPLPSMIRARPKTAMRVAAVLAVTVAVVLAATPLGRDGVARLGALFDSNDVNYSFREQAMKRALSKDDAGEVILGKGVGLQPTYLDVPLAFDMAGALANPLRLEPHNSWVTIYQRAGVIGLILILVPLGYVVWKMIRARRDELVALLLSFLVFMGTLATFNVVLENSFVGVWFWLPLFVGAVLALDRGSASPATTP